jgi:hypothetical protein
MRGNWDVLDFGLLHEKMETSPAGMAWRCSYIWWLAATEREGEAREGFAHVSADDFAALPFDVNWCAGMGELASAAVVLGDPELAAPVYERLLPYEGGALTSGRAIGSFGSTQRLLGELAALLGRTDEAKARLEAGIARDEAVGFAPWAQRGREALRSVTAGRTFPSAGR